MDSKFRKEIFDEMKRTAGWVELDGIINSRISQAKTRLYTVDPSDVRKIVEYQSVIKNYEWLLAQINQTTNKQEE